MPRRRHPDGHGAGRRVGLGRSAAPLRHDDVQGDAAARDRLCRAGISRSRSASRTTGSCRRACRPTPSDPRKCCTQLDPDSIATWYIDGRQPAAGQIHPQSRVSRRRSASCSSRAATASTKERSRRRSSPSRRALGGTMTLEDLAAYHRRVGHAGDDELSRLRRLHAAAAGADLGHRRDPQHPRDVRAEVGAGADAGDARSGESEVLAPRSSKPRSSRSTISTPTTPIRISPRCRSSGCCRRRTRSRCAAASIRIARPRRRRAATPRAPATPSCCRPPIAAATWWRGSTASSTASARASPCPATASRCTIAAGCSRSIRRART